MIVYIPSDVLRAVKHRMGSGDEPTFHMDSPYGFDGGSGRTHVVTTHQKVFVMEEDLGEIRKSLEFDLSSITGLETVQVRTGRYLAVLEQGQEEACHFMVGRLQLFDLEDLEPHLLGNTDESPAIAEADMLPLSALLERDYHSPREESIDPDEQVLYDDDRDELLRVQENLGRASPGPVADRPRVRKESSPKIPGDQVATNVFRVNDIADGKMIRVDLDRTHVAPGGRVRGKVVFGLAKSTRVRRVWTRFMGEEETQITVSRGKSSHTYRERSRLAFEEELALGSREDLTVQDALAGLSQPGREKMSGEFVVPFDFPVPKPTLATFDGVHAKSRYWFQARIDIPWAFDLKENVAITVPPVVLPDRSGVSFASDRKEISLVARLDPFKPIPGEVLEGEVTMGNTGDKTVKEIEVAIISFEHAKASRYTRTNSLRTTKTTFPGTPGSHSFALEFPPPIDAVGSHYQIYHALQVRARIAWGRDVIINEVI